MKQAGFTYTSSVSDMVTADFVPDGKDKGEDELVGLKQQQQDPAGSRRFIPAETAALLQKYPTHHTPSWSQA